MLELPGGWLRLIRFSNWVNATDSIADLLDHSGTFHVMVGFVGVIHEDKFGSLESVSERNNYRLRVYSNIAKNLKKCKYF